MAGANERSAGERGSAEVTNTGREAAHERLRHLYDISKRLAGLQSVEETLPAVLAIADDAVPLRSVVLIVELAGRRRTLVWPAEGPSAEAQREDQARALDSYAYLTGLAPAGALERDDAPAPASGEVRRRELIALPLVVDHQRVFGVLQIELRTPDEGGLFFMNAVANQMAVAIDRRRALDREIELRRLADAERARIEILEERHRAVAAALRISEERRRLALESTGVGTWDFDVATRSWSCDAPCLSLLGLPPSAVVDFGVIGAALHPEERPRMLEAMARALDPGSGGKYQEDHRLIGLLDGVERWAAVRGRIQFDAAGSPARFLGTTLDVTERKRAEEEQRLLAAAGSILAGSLDAAETLQGVADLSVRFLGEVCIIDVTVEDDGQPLHPTVAHADPDRLALAEELARLPLDRARPHLAERALASRHSTLVPEVSEAYLASVAQSGEHLRLLRALEVRSALAVPLLARGRLFGAMLFLRSSPGHRHGPAHLRVAEELSRMTALAVDNALLHRTARRAIEARDAVLGVVAHELRDPLHAASMASSLLRARLTGATPVDAAATKRNLDQIARSAHRMERLVEDLLDVTRVEAGRLSVRLSSQDPAQVVVEALEAARAAAEARSLTLEARVEQGLARVEADRGRILQVLANLVGNAVKFTPAGGRVTLGASAASGGVRFWVADTGAGIGEEAAKHLFDRFWQARVGDRRGAGLGLSICKGIVEAHGGRLWLESRGGPEGGATLSFTLPEATNPPAAPPPQR